MEIGPNRLVVLVAIAARLYPQAGSVRPACDAAVATPARGSALADPQERLDASPHRA